LAPNRADLNSQAICKARHQVVFAKTHSNVAFGSICYRPRLGRVWPKPVTWQAGVAAWKQPLAGCDKLRTQLKVTQNAAAAVAQEDERLWNV
jgi:hypothetical protein